MDVTLRVVGTADVGQIEALEKRLKGLDSVIQGAFKGDAASRAAEAVKRVGDEAATAGDKAKTAGGMFDGWLGGLAKIGLASTGVGALVGGVTALGGAMSGLVSGNAEMETYETQLGTLMGSAEAAKEELAKLAKFGAETPFELPELIQADKVLIGFGLTGEAVKEKFGMDMDTLRTSIGDMAAGTGVNFAELANTWGKFSSGASGEAISRLQELGIVTREQLAAAGVEFSKSGALVSPLPMALEAATKIANEKFGGGMAALSNTFEGKMSTLADTWNQIKIAFMAPVFDIAKAGLDAILPALSGFATFAGNAAKIMSGEFGPEMKAAQDALGGFAQPLMNLKAIFNAVGLAMSGNFEEAFQTIGEILPDFGIHFAGIYDIGAKVQETFDKITGGVRDFIDGFNLEPDMSFIEKIQNGLGNMLAGFGLEGDNPVSGLVDGIISGLQGLVDGFNNARPGVESFIASMVGNFNTMKENIGPIIESILPIVGSAITSLGEGFAIVAPILGDVMAIIGDLAGKLAEFLWPILQTVFAFMADHQTTFITLGAIIAAVAGGPITMIIAALVAIGAVWPKVVEGFNSLKAKLTEIVASASAFVAGIVGKFTEVKTNVSTSVDGTKTKITDVWNSIVSTVQGAVDSVKKFVEDRFNAVRGFIDSVLNTIKGIVLTIWNAIPEDIRARLIKIYEYVRTKFDEIKAKIETTLNAALAIVRTIWENIKASVQEKIDGVVAAVREKFDLLRDAVGEKLAEAKAKIDEIWTSISENIIAPIVSAVEGARTKFDEFKESVTTRVRATVDEVRKKFLEFVGNVLGPIVEAKNKAVAKATEIKDGILGKIRETVDKITGIGGDIIQGLIDGLTNARDKVFTFMADLARGMLDEIIGAFIVKSPSRVMEEIGFYILEGLRLGLEKHDRKTIEAMAAVVSGMNNVLGGLQDFAGKIAKFVVPDASVVALAKKRFTDIVVIVSGFIKDFAYLGSLLPVANSSEASGAQKGLIDAVVRSKFGIGFDDLLTGSEADWATRLADIIGKVVATWGGIADGLTKIAEAKVPDQAAWQRVQDTAVQVIIWAKSLLDLPPVPGLSDLTDTVKAAVDMLTTISKAGIDKAAAITADVLDRASENLKAIGGWAAKLTTEWVNIEGNTPEAQAKMLVNMRSFADTMRAAGDILAAGALGSLADVVGVTINQLGIVRTNLLMVGEWASGMVKEWLAEAGTPEERAAWLENMRNFADTMKAATEIAKIADFGELNATIEVDLDHLRQSLGFIRDQLAPVILEIVDAWEVAADAAKEQTERMGAFSGWLGAAIGIAKLTEVGELKSHILVNMEVMQGILEWMRDTFAPLMESIAAAWKRTNEAAAPVTEHMQDFANWIGAAVAIAKVTEVGELQANILVNMDVLKGILEWMRDTFAPLMEEIAAKWGETSESAKPAIDRMQAFAAWIGAAVDIAKMTEVGELKSHILVNMTYLVGILEWMRDTFVPAIQDIVKEWTTGDKEAKALTERMGLFAGLIKVASDIAKAASDGLGSIGNLGTADIGPAIERIKNFAKQAFEMLGEISKDMSLGAITARANFATQAAIAVKALGEIGAGFSGIMAMASGDLFAADPTRTDLGFMQRVRGRRADFKASMLTDTIKRAIAALTTALATIDLPSPTDPKILALDALAGAFANLADALEKLGSANIPSPAQIAALVAAGTGIGGGGGGGGGGFGSGQPFGTGGGENIPAMLNMNMTLNQPVLLDGDTIGQAVQRIIVSRGMSITLNPVGG